MPSRPSVAARTRGRPNRSANTTAKRKTPAKQSPAKQSPAKQSPAKQTPAKQSPAKKAPAKKAPAKQTPAKQSPTKKAPTKKAPAKKAPAKKAPTKKTPAKQSPTKQSPAKKAPTKKTTKRKVPAKQSPANRKAVALSTSVRRSAPSRTPPATATTGMRTTDRSPVRRSPKDGRVWVLSVGFEDRNLAKWGGAKWDPDRRRWFYVGDVLPERLTPFATTAHSWERWQEDDENGRRPVPRPGSVTLRAHQTEAASSIATAHAGGKAGFVLADDVGLGKTFSAIAAFADQTRPLRILVLCPLSVVPHWRRSIDTYGPGPHRWCVLNYDRAKALLDVPETAATAKRARTRNKRIATKGRSLVDWDVVICDEAHRLKNPASQRSAAVRNLIAAHGDPAFVLWMSATAGQNPLELAYLAPLLAQRTGAKAKDLADFEAWCRSQGIGVRRGSFGSWVWERNEADLVLLRDLLFAPGRGPAVGLRRRPQDLEGWPELVRSLAPVELSAPQRRLYEEAWDEFCAALALVKAGSDSTNPMVAALRFRQKSSLLRVEQTVAFARDLLDDGLQVAVSTQFLDTATALADALDAPVVSGAQSAKDREANRIAFQRGERRSIVFTVTEGISLHAGEQVIDATDAERALLIHDLRWSALDMAQIEGRCHRDGQNAIAYYLYGEGTVEEKVAAAVLQKLTDMAAMLGDDLVGLDALLHEGGWR